MNILKKIKYKYYYLKEQLCNVLSYCKLFGKLYDFDWTSVLLVERHQLKRMRKCLLETHHHVDWEYDYQRITLAIKLLDRIIDEVDPVIKLINTPQIFPEYIPCEWKICKYINTKNADRFLTNSYKKTDNALFVEYLYNEKLWNLYYKVRKQYTKSWWV